MKNMQQKKDISLCISLCISSNCLVFLNSMAQTMPHIRSLHSVQNNKKEWSGDVHGPVWGADRRIVSQPVPYPQTGRCPLSLRGRLLTRGEPGGCWNEETWELLRGWAGHLMSSTRAGCDAEWAEGERQPLQSVTKACSDGWGRRENTEHTQSVTIFRAFWTWSPSRISGEQIHKCQLTKMLILGGTATHKHFLVFSWTVGFSQKCCTTLIHLQDKPAAHLLICSILVHLLKALVTIGHYIINNISKNTVTG